MKPDIRTLDVKKLIGQHINMSLVENKTFQLWNDFMPRRHEIKNRLDENLISLQVYPVSYDFENFNPHASFEKWAAVEVSDFNKVPEGMDTLILPGGQYAVFIYKGTPNEAGNFFRYILGEWLPNSGYRLDKRPHFEVLGSKYKNAGPDSEEEVWIPIIK